MISIEKREISNTFTHLPIYNISFVLSVFQVSPIFQFLMIFGVNSTFTFYLRFHRAAMTFPSSRSLKSLRRRSLGAIDWTLVVKRVTRVLHRKIGPYDSREGHRLKGRLATDAQYCWASGHDIGAGEFEFRQAQGRTPYWKYEKSGRKIVQYTCLVKLSMKFCFLFGMCKIMQLEKYWVKLSLEAAELIPRTVSSTWIYFNCKISENI